MITLAALSRLTKFWIAVSLASLFIYNAWIVRGSYAILIGYLTNVPADVHYVAFTGATFWVGHMGLTARFVALLLGFAAAYLLWVRKWSIFRARKLVAAALVLEGGYFASLIPSLWFLQSLSPSLEYGYLLMILFTAPFLWVLAAKVFRYGDVAQRSALLKVSIVTFAAYTVALFANEVFRWASMISADTLAFLFKGIRAIGFLNAVVVMPFSVVFALVATRSVFREKESSAIKWIGASLAIVGLSYLIYLIYSFLADSLRYVVLVDIWTIPLLGLGIALVINSQVSASD